MIKQLLLLFAVIALSSCASMYIGAEVDTDKPGVCNFDTFPASCTWTTSMFVLQYKIEATGQPNEYKVFGTAQAINGGDATYTEYKQAQFTLLLVNYKRVVDTFIIGVGGGSLGQTIKFSRTFIFEGGFDASILTYEMQVQG